MADSCCSAPRVDATTTRRYRRALWFALVINATMFAVEIVSGWQGGSVSLLADAVDFFGDAANYAISLFVFSFGAAWRSRTALSKGAMMSLYGLFILGQTIWSALNGSAPQAEVMGVVAVIALVANVTVAVVLYAFRQGDADMRSVWLCSRNDAIGNLAVLAAALGVFGTGARWPDLVVAAGMAILALTSAFTVIRHARHEMAVQAG
jgi:cation diffusion facilitator family transporter